MCDYFTILSTNFIFIIFIKEEVLVFDFVHFYIINIIIYVIQIRLIVLMDIFFCMLDRLFTCYDK